MSALMENTPTSASSPYSQRSTDPSSPEASTSINGVGSAAAAVTAAVASPAESSAQAQQKAAAAAAAAAAREAEEAAMATSLYTRTPRHALNGFPPSLAGMQGMPGMEAMLQQYAASMNMPHIFKSNPLPQKVSPPADLDTIIPSQSPPPSARASPTKRSSIAGSKSGPTTHSRSEPPFRAVPLDMLPVQDFDLDTLAASSQLTSVLLQGDPQVITKQRVETAIRVIIDLVRAIPATPSSPPLPMELSQILPADVQSALYTLARIGSFRTLRLQTGATTKTSSKKQQQLGPTPNHQLIYLETAVFMSGENGKRVYACKRCRSREARRRLNKDQNRKKQSNSESESSSPPPKPVVQTATPPSPNYITGVNPEHYDPHRNGQVVEEPSWDPHTADWRHEIVLFNSPPEVQIREGSCNWLPFRVVCYGKCHGEKLGFKIRFTFRLWDGRIVGQAFTNPIRITDDHKTDTKGKPRIEGMTSTLAQPAQPRARKGRASAASSRRQSPAPSEVESVQSVSEAGAVVQKQTPMARAGKPYERPASAHPQPLAPLTTMNGDSHAPRDAAPRFQRQLSSTSIHSPTAAAPMSSIAGHNSLNNQAWNGNNGMGFGSAFGGQQPANAGGRPSLTELRQPTFNGMQAIDTSGNYALSTPVSAASSNLTSPISATQPLSDDGLFLPDINNQSPISLVNAFASLNGLNSLPTSTQLQSQAQLPNPMLFDTIASPHDVVSPLNSSNFGSLFGGSNQSQLSESLDDSVFSAFGDRSSAFYSDSGVPPHEDSMEGFLDFSGGEDAANNAQLNQPFGSSVSNPAFSPTAVSNGLSPIFNLDMDNSPGRASIPGATPVSPEAAALQEEQIRQFLAVLQQQQQQPVVPQPAITHVIPAEGPLAGGITVAIAGQRFVPGMVIMFGSRVATTTFVSESFVQCTLPPAIEPGTVPVHVQGSTPQLGAPVQTFKYNGMDKEMMRLALEVRDQYQNSSSDAAYRLAQHIAKSQQSGSEYSESSSVSPEGPSPNMYKAAASGSPSSQHRNKSSKKSSDTQQGLQETIIEFLAALDEDSPGSLRRSGAINHRNEAQQSLLHVATVMGFDRLLRRLVVIGAHLDVQDVNGFTPLAFASLCGQATCARVLIEAGASYDRPTAFGEMPLDLASKKDVHGMLLSAVWSTSPDALDETTHSDGAASLVSAGGHSEIDNDNPSSDSELEGEPSIAPATMRRRKSKRSKGKRRVSRAGSFAAHSRTHSPPQTASVLSEDTTPHATPAISPFPPDDHPPPYEPRRDHADDASAASWVSRTWSHMPGSSFAPPPFKLPDGVWERLPLTSLWPTGAEDDSAIDDKSADAHAAQQHGWVAFPAPSWETLTKMTSPEEVKLLTQAMAAAALNAVVQSTSASASMTGLTTARPRKSRAARLAADTQHKRRKSRQGSGSGNRSQEEIPASPPPTGLVKHVKQDRMLYLFWLPILLFVGFWLLVTALPIATGFCLIYARTITRAIKQRI